MILKFLWKSLPLGCSHNLQLSRSERLHHKRFQLRTNRGKEHHFNKLKPIKYFDIINIAKCWCEIGCISVFLYFCITEAQLHTLSLLHFPRWLCLIHGQFDMHLRHVRRSVKCKCKCFCLVNIQKWLVFSLVLLSLSQLFPPLKRFS